MTEKVDSGDHVQFDENIEEIKATDYVPETALERKMVDALKDITCAKDRCTPTFVRVQLQFPKAAKAFRSMKATFEKYDVDHSGTIDFDEIKVAFRELGGVASESELAELFDTADSEKKRELLFREFVVFLGVCALTGQLSNSSGLVSAFHCAVDAFDGFDATNQGVIVYADLHHALDDDSERVNTPDLLLARMKEMDHDNNGYVIFPEFLMAFMDWVGVDDEDSDDEE